MSRVRSIFKPMLYLSMVLCISVGYPIEVYAAHKVLACDWEAGSEKTLEQNEQESDSHDDKLRFSTLGVHWLPSSSAPSNTGNRLNIANVFLRSTTSQKLYLVYHRMLIDS